MITVGRKIELSGHLVTIGVPYSGYDSDKTPFDIMDDAIKRCGDSDSLWHWSDGFSLCADTITYHAQGGLGAKVFLYNFSNTTTKALGFRPLLTPAKPSDCNDSFELFRDLKDGAQLNAYTMLLDGNPINTANPSQITSYHSIARNNYSGHRIQIVDDYYGDDFLIPWVFFGGCAMAAKNILLNISWNDLVSEGFASLTKQEK